ncbi:MAG: MFS transporter [Sphingobacteriales bacterium]|nr:MAG: MFS transporter [Sphingobacteriales bacterium]
MKNRFSRPAITPFTSYQKLVVALLSLLQFTIVLDFMVLSPLGDFLMKGLDIDPSGFGLVVSSYALSAGASGFLAAGFADKYDRKKLLVFFYTGFIVGTLGCALANSYVLLLTARIVTGLFGGVIGAVSFAIIADLFLPEQRGRVIGTTQMALAASQVLGIPISLYLANHWGWHAPFIMIVVLAAAILLVIVAWMKPVTGHLAVQSDKSPYLHLLHALAKRPYQITFVSTAALSIGGFMMMPFSSAFLVNNIKVTAEQLPLVFMASGIAAIVVMPLTGRLSDKMDKYKLFVIGSIIALIMITVYTHLGEVPLWQIISVNILMMVGIMSRMIPAMSINMAIPDMKDRGAFMSINSSLQQMAGGIAAICAGLIVRQESKSAPLEHYDTLGYVVAAVMILCLFLLYKVSELAKAKEAAVATHQMKAEEKAEAIV